MITIESVRTTRDIHISNNPQTWERIPVTYISVRDYNMDTPINPRMRKFVDSDFDLLNYKTLDDVIVKHGDDGQAITDILCKKHGLEKHRYTKNHQVI